MLVNANTIAIINFLNLCAFLFLIHLAAAIRVEPEAALSSTRITVLFESIILVIYKKCNLFILKDYGIVFLCTTLAHD